MENKQLIEAIARAMTDASNTAGGITFYHELAQAALAAIRDSGHVILPNDWIRRKMPRIDPGGGGLLNEVPLDEEVHCCQWTLYQERERVNAEFDKLVGIEPPDVEEDDPTPWCHICGARTKDQCHCGPIARND